jgi:hypothetical protein
VLVQLWIQRHWHEQAPLPFGRQHLHQLAPADRQGGQGLAGRVGQRSGFWPNRGREVSQDLCVEAVRLGQLGP